MQGVTSSLTRVTLVLVAAQQWDLFRARVTLGQRLVLVLAVAGLQPARQLSWCARVDMVHGATTGGA